MGMLSADAERHLDEQEALDWLEGRMPAERLGPALAHVGRCDDCRHLVAALARAIDEGPGADALPTVQAGDVIGAYRVAGTLGAGAMGVVFRGIDPRLHREVALKVVHDPRLTAARVREEARALARLNHPHVVTVLAAGDSAYGPWIAMELVEGWTLAEWARRTRPSVQERERALVEAARGLLAAHEAGIVHGDFKPANVLVGRDGRVRVADFGLARPVRGAAPSLGPHVDPTSTNTAIGGTPAYLAPEVLGGGRPSQASDQFSLCVTAWELLGGSRPFTARDTKALRDAALQGPPSPVASIPRAWREPLRRGLAARPDDRYPDLARLIVDVAPVRRGRSRGSLLPAALLGLGAVGLVTALALPEPDRCGAIGPAPGMTELDEATLPEVDAEDRARLGRWVGAWTAEREAACRVEDERRTACLELLQARFEGRLEGLRDGQRPRSGVLRDIGDPVSCATPGLVRDEAPSPEVRSLQKRYAAARGRWGSVAPTPEIRRRYAALVEEADALGVPRIQLLARTSLGRAEHLLGEFEPAAKNFESAYFRAIELEDHRAAWESALGMAQCLGHGLARYEEAIQWVEHARAQLDLARAPERGPETDKIHGELLVSLGRYEEAETILQRALDSLRDTAPLRDRATLLGTLGNAMASQWRGEEAVSYFREAIVFHERRGLAANKDLPRALNGLAVGLTQLERFDEAIEVYERAAVLSATLGPSMDLPAAQLQMNLGVLRGMQGDDEAALEHYHRGCKVVEAQLHGSREETACHLNIARTRARLERHEEAVAAARRCIGTAEVIDPPAYDLLSRCLGIAARSLDALGQHEAAASNWRRRLAVHGDLQDGDPADRLGDEVALARSLLGAGERDEAREIAAGVRSGLEALPEPDEELDGELRSLELALAQP